MSTDLEAFWIKFECWSEELAGEPKPSWAMKVYLGGVNGISGEPMIPNMGTFLKKRNGQRREQDYLVVPPQKWLDGIAHSPGVVRQFVAVPFKSGLSVEQQITGMDNVGGVQLEIIPSRDQLTRKSRKISREIYRRPSFAERILGKDLECTPAQLGLVGEVYLRTHDPTRTPSLGEVCRKFQSRHPDSLIELKEIHYGIEEFWRDKQASAGHDHLTVKLGEQGQAVELRVGSNFSVSLQLLSHYEDTSTHH